MANRFAPISSMFVIGNIQTQPIFSRKTETFQKQQKHYTWNLSKLSVQQEGLETIRENHTDRMGVA